MTPLEFCGALFLIMIGILGLLLSVVLYSLPKRISTKISGSHVLITGGSKGIGKSIAVEFIKQGASNVTICARSRPDLEKAQSDLQSYCKEVQKVNIYELDITGGFEKILETVRQIESEVGFVDVLVNNAGFVIQGEFGSLPAESVLKQMEINYIGAAHLARAVLPSMKERGHGHINFVSSAAGQCAIWGYGAYSPSKFAVRALADVLAAECRPYNIGVSVLYPPNTETEGFQVEKREMPEQIKQISGSAGLFSSQEVANKCVTTIKNGAFNASVGFEGWLLCTLAAGASPECSPLQAIAQTLFAGIFRGIMLIYQGSFNDIIQKLHKKTNKD
ncbi:unnamed protein product [Bursaphelenchus xylophilus]|uniref:3-dehydrosphinganine reductase n=1 Tax=Bursaphelenchus xylophilus TaxID=6326 RepID=A0A1I7S4A9_BURXY|nr:unnamed protein product [Bursaphelenchus xylophilus]CAG9116902.1 unnamed protein product [Bursaphelenchus xylophilus]